LSGRLSDRIGRKQLIVASFVLSSFNVLVLALLGHRAGIAFALIVVQGVIGAPAYSLDRIIVADLIPEEERRERGYATLRVASNLGTFAGPPLAALLIYLGGWTSFLLGIATLGLVGAALTIALLPADKVVTLDDRGDVGSLRTVIRDRPFALLLLSTLLA